MEEAVDIAPNKRRKTETDYQLHIIRQVRTHDEPLVENTQVQSIALAIHALGGSYHRNCYKEYTNKEKLARASRRYEKALKHKKALL